MGLLQGRSDAVPVQGPALVPRGGVSERGLTAHQERLRPVHPGEAVSDQGEAQQAT